MDNGVAQNLPSAAVPLNEIIETYGQCLDLSRAYLASQPSPQDDKNDFDPEDLDEFMAARREMFASAREKFQLLENFPSEPPDSPQALSRAELTRRAEAVLEEMAAMEKRLSDYLGEQLSRMRRTIREMRRSEPVFKRYAHLGGKISPSRITRHE